MMHVGRLVAFVVLLALGAIGRHAPAQPVRVATAIVPHAWLMEQIAGDLVGVQTIVPAGADPHVFQPSDAEISNLMRCGAIFRAGIPLERGPWMDAAMRSGRVRIVDLREGIELIAVDSDDAHRHDPSGEACAHEHHDPHTWTSPANLRIQARTIAQTLESLAPEHAGVFDSRLAALEKRLEDLDTELRLRLEPCRGRAFLVLHPSWAYFAKAYGVRQVAVEVAGLAPSDRELTDLQRIARAEHVSTIVVQPQVSPRTADAVARAIGGRIRKVDPLSHDLPAALRSLADAIADSR